MNFYKSAAQVIDHLDRHQGSVKGSLAAAGIKTANPGETKRVLALVIETLKYRPVLNQLLETVALASLEKLTFPRKAPRSQPSSNSLLLVLLHDLLFSSRQRVEASDKWPPKEAVLRHQARLRAELVRIQIREGKSRKEDLARTADAGVDARYIRWNPNVDLHREGDWSLEALHHHLEKDLGFSILTRPVYPVLNDQYFMDPHLSEHVLVFPASSDWWAKDKWYESGAIILQDKASCFPAKILMDAWEDGEGDCLDATAAPGNKTSYISALMGDRGRLHAFERSPVRYKTLARMLEKAACRNVKAQRGDFLEADPAAPDWSRVTRILLDPSCSGSGIVNRLDYLVRSAGANEAEVEAETDAKNERLEKLAAFQLQMILHAFKFPKATRLVYSTCSVHAEEDERVIMKALGSPTAKATGWTLAPRSAVLPAWPRRGRPEEMGEDTVLADSVIRCLPNEDHTNGFFVACFVRGSQAAALRTATLIKKRKHVPDSDAGDDSKDVARKADGDTTEHAGERKLKTQAQLDRAKRKKAAQKARQKELLPALSTAQPN